MFVIHTAAESVKEEVEKIEKLSRDTTEIGVSAAPPPDEIT